MINGTRVCVVARRGRHQFKPLGARSRRRHFDETDGMATSGAMDAPAPSVSGKARYIKGATLGEGTFGVVTKAEDTLTRKHVAIKKIRMGKFREGINFTAIREIKLLQELRHPHVIELVDCFPHKRNLNLVFECCESDLEAVIKDKFLPLGTPEIKSYMQMTLKAVAYCHASWVLHRDLKPNNLLIAPNGALKLADFGLARVFGSPNRKFTHQVFARWYRAPELLLGSKAYGPGVDIWAVGCIFAELMLRKPFFPGSSDIDQLGRIYAGLGTPTEESWPGHANLPTGWSSSLRPRRPCASCSPPRPRTRARSPVKSSSRSIPTEESPRNRRCGTPISTRSPWRRRSRTFRDRRGGSATRAAAAAAATTSAISCPRRAIAAGAARQGAPEAPTGDPPARWTRAARRRNARRRNLGRANRDAVRTPIRRRGPRPRTRTGAIAGVIRTGVGRDGCRRVVDLLVSRGSVWGPLARGLRGWRGGVRQTRAEHGGQSVSSKTQVGPG